MSKYWTGLRNVGSFQVSGHPFMTGSVNLDNQKVHLVAFPFVTQNITIINTSASGSFRVHLHSGSSTAVTTPGHLGAQTMDGDSDIITGRHYINVPSGDASLTMNIKCSKIYISNSSSADNLAYQVFAELTNIPTGSMYNLTSSGIITGR